MKVDNFLLKLICTLKLSSLIFADLFHEKFTKAMAEQDLIAAIDEHIVAFHHKYRVINIIKATEGESHEVNEIVSQIFMKSGGSYSIWLFNHKSISRRKFGSRKQMVVLLDGINTFRKLLRRIDSNTFKFNGRYLIVLLNDRKPGDVEEIFDALWGKFIFNVNLLYVVEEQVKLLTFMPFRKDAKCRNSDPIPIPAAKPGKFRKFDELLPYKFQDLHGCPIKVLTYADTVAVYKQKNQEGSVVLKGFDMELIRTLSSSMNFKLDLRFSEEPQAWGQIFSNGSAVGVLRELMDKRGDIGIGNYFLKTNRLRYLGSSESYFSYSALYVVPPGSKLSPFEKLLQPFETSIWVMMTAALFVSLVVIGFVKRQPKRVQEFVFGKGVESPAMNLLVITFGSSQKRSPSWNFARFIFVAFSLLCLVLRSIYQGSLYISLQSEIEEKGLDSIEEITESGFKIKTYQSHEDTFESREDLKSRRAWSIVTVCLLTKVSF